MLVWIPTPLTSPQQLVPSTGALVLRALEHQNSFASRVRAACEPTHARKKQHILEQQRLINFITCDSLDFRTKSRFPNMSMYVYIMYACSVFLHIWAELVVCHPLNICAESPNMHNIYRNKFRCMYTYIHIYICMYICMYIHIYNIYCTCAQRLWTDIYMYIYREICMHIFMSLTQTLNRYIHVYT